MYVFISTFLLWSKTTKDLLFFSFLDVQKVLEALVDSFLLPVRV